MPVVKLFANLQKLAATINVTVMEIAVKEQDIVAIFTPIAGVTSPNSYIDVRRN
jgi:molybdopterin converting factor small subunit